jgi:PAS domain S-box-containing protein
MYANAVLSRITGYTLEEMRLFATEIIMLALHVEDWGVAWQQVVEYVAAGVLSSRLELCFPHKNGTARWAELYATAIDFEDRPTILVSCVDITERKQAEIALYQTYSELELEVRERTEALVSTNGALQGEILERRQIEEALRRAQAELETRVRQRTQELAQTNESLQHEINERRQAEQEILLLHTISQEIEKTQDLSEAMIIMLRRVCEAVEWNVGEAWILSDDGTTMVYGPVWNSGRNPTTSLPIDKPVSCRELPQRVWQTRQTEWIEDLTSTSDDLSACKDIAAVSGLRAALGVPVMAGSEIVAAMVFFKCESTPEDQRRINVISTIATHLGSVLERKRVQEEKAILFEKVKHQREQLRHLALRRRHLAQQVIVAQEEERQRVSRELHDEAGQALTALRISLEMINRELAAGSNPLEQDVFHERMNQAILLCDSTSAQIRNLAHDLRPGALDDLGLHLALQGFCRDFADRTKLVIRYTGADVSMLSETMELCLYRFLQEGLNNVAKHAGADCVWVDLSTEDRIVTLSIRDNGGGFDMHAVLFAAGHTQGIGLLGIDERLQSLGGSLDICSELGKGTVLIASIPLQEEI